MDITLRAGKPEDSQECGRIAYEAFRAIAEEHGFPPDFPSPEVASTVVSHMLRHPQTYSVVAESGGKIIGSNFMDERAIIGGIGPISVDPEVQNSGAGKAMMLNALERVAKRGFPGVRLVQSAYHMRSLSLYTKIGFDPRETLSVFHGPALNVSIEGFKVRDAARKDLDACDELCRYVHGFERGSELSDAINRGGIAKVVERGGRITGYTTSIAFGGYSVGESNDDIQALIGATREFDKPGFLVPSCNAELMRWCLARGLRVIMQMTLMTIGLYNEPRGAYLPSILF
ncbi:MAG TPA: GNAT family N-acetyltransferase [Candidatus Binataceae bacterium]|nr:GNAT family N-acetyltransferase [Candidatus Binataceae bacterium]